MGGRRVGGQELWCGLGKKKRCSPGLSRAPLRDFFLDPTHFLFTIDFTRRTLITEGLRVSQMRLLLPHSTMVAAVSSSPMSGTGGSIISIRLFVYNKGRFWEITTQPFLMSEFRGFAFSFLSLRLRLKAADSGQSWLANICFFTGTLLAK